MTSTKRDNYIDILRGILMILVVMVHIDTYLIMPKINLEFNIILTKIRMPLFFFISGFLAHSKNYNSNIFTNRLFNRIICQLYPTIIIFLLYNIVTGTPINDALSNPSKNGYWFTYIVFLHFCTYSFILLCLSHFKISERKIQLILAFLVICSLCNLKPLHSINFSNLKWGGVFVSVSIFCLYSIFLSGSIHQIYFQQNRSIA